MLICIDYDKTYTLDTGFWDGFIALSKQNGVSVICCTLRHEDGEGDAVKRDLLDKVDAIYFTARQAKQGYLQSIGVNPDVWIDDSPYWILYGST